MGRWKKRGGYAVAMRVITHLARNGLFREKDLVREKLSHNWLSVAAHEGWLRRHDRGVWSRSDYTPTQYELVQIRFPKAVFWGPTALWLHGAEPTEPETLWVAIHNTSQVPTTLDPTTYVIRTRHLEDDVVALTQPNTFTELRAHSVERARRDVSRADFHQLVERAASRDQWALPRHATLLSAALPRERRHQLPPQREDWIAK